MIFPFKIPARSFLGIDIGSSSIKVVELSKTGKTVKLENYAEAAASIPLLSSQETAQNLRFILDQAKIKTKKAVFTLPDFSSFFTWFDLPAMSKAEIPEAVRYEAKQHIPTPLSGVTLDWQIIGGGEKGKKIKILLVVFPNEFIVQYSTIAKLSQIEPQVLEAEVFALSRSSLVNENKTTALVDIGARSTTCSIIDNGVLKRSYSFDISGNKLTQIISQSLNTDELKAEELKKKYGLAGEKKLREILLPLINLILNEIKKVLESFYQSETKTVQKVILAGGTALLPGLREYFESDLKKEVQITEPFFGISHPQTLEKTLKEIGPSYAIAVGAALRGIE